MGMQLAPLSRKESIRNAQLKRCATLRRMLDAVVAHLFLHTFNCAKVNTRQNLGRAASLPSIRDLICRYIGSKTHNKGDQRRESVSLVHKDARKLQEYQAAWTMQRVTDFITKVEEIVVEWRRKVKESKSFKFFLQQVSF